MAVDAELLAYIDRRFAELEEQIVAGIVAGLRTHNSRPQVERSGLEIAYGTVVGADAAQVIVALDADVANPVPMFTVRNVVVDNRVACLLVPPSSALVLGTLGGNEQSSTFQLVIPADQTDNAFEVVDVNGNLLFAVTATGALDLPEQTAPAAPAANTGRVYGVDASGKTRIAGLFPTGAQQTIATEP